MNRRCGVGCVVVRPGKGEGLRRVPSVKRTRLPPTSVTAKAPGVLGGWSAVFGSD